MAPEGHAMMKSRKVSPYPVIRRSALGTPGVCLAPDGRILLMYSGPQDQDGAEVGAVFIEIPEG